jgi:Holliday junction resolvase RusA-like endonuclease
MSIKFTIPVKCRTKKNHGQIVHTKTGRHVVLPSPQYKEFEKEVIKYVTAEFGNIEPIDFKCNLKCIFYKDRNYQSDLVGYLQAIQDALVKAGILKDDNTNIVNTVNGSEVRYDKENPRIEVEIEAIESTEVF